MDVSSSLQPLAVGAFSTSVFQKGQYVTIRAGTAEEGEGRKPLKGRKTPERVSGGFRLQPRAASLLTLFRDGPEPHRAPLWDSGAWH